MICDFNVPWAQISLGERAELAATHLLNIPERLLNVITQLVKLVLFGLGSCLTFGQSEFMNQQFILAGKRVLTNATGLGTSLIGTLAPINAVRWQIDLVNKLFDKKELKNNGHKGIPALLSV